MPFSVPFGALDHLTVFGEAPAGALPLPGYLPPLQMGTLHPSAPAGMTVEMLPWSVRFSSECFSIGFSLLRPEILHLGWDGVGGKRAGENRVQASYAAFQSGAGLFSGLSGPLLRTLHGDFGANLWTGQVEAIGDQVHYRDLHCGQGMYIDACFTINAEGFRLELTQRAQSSIPAIEVEGWRLAWNCAAAMTAAAALPTLRPGRNGEVELPMCWAGDGNGALRCEKLSGDAYLQIESYRGMRAVTGGMVLGPRAATEACPAVPAGVFSSSWECSVANFAPLTSSDDSPELPPSIRRHWGSIYSCFRPELGGFSNNAVSTNCHVNQGHPAELAVFTRQPDCGPDPLALYRFTIERALLGGGGYGFWRNLYLDTDPILVSGAGRLHQARTDLDWLRRVEPGLVQAIDRMLGNIGPEGLVVCRDLSGNSGSFRWSSNAMDVVGFGHLDAYVNAWSYRGLRNAAPLLAELGQRDLSARCTTAADRLCEAYPTYLLNPETGWIAGWRSHDGQLHDAAFLWVNGVACAFGLLPQQTAAEALRRLEQLRREAGAS